MNTTQMTELLRWASVGELILKAAPVSQDAALQAQVEELRLKVVVLRETLENKLGE